MGRLNRREFTREASLAFLSGVAVTVSACGGGGYGSSPTASTMPPQGTAPGDEVGQISDNHGHEAIITAAELMEGGAVEMDIAGTAGHSHIVRLPPEAVDDIRDGRPVRTSSTETMQHAHEVTFNPESPDPPDEY
jgi:hypothetical protein